MTNIWLIICLYLKRAHGGHQEDEHGREAGHSAPKRSQNEDEERLRHEQDFIAFDLNADSFVDAHEIRTVSPNLEPVELSGFFIAADKNEDGLINLDEYIEASMELDQE